MEYKSTDRWVEELKRFPNLRDLLQSDFYQHNRDELHKLLHEADLETHDAIKPRVRSFLRMTSWNIEKGKNLHGVIETFLSHPILMHADLILLNEVDVGMSRSGNVHIAKELARALQMNYAFAPAHLELTQGTGDDLSIPGANAIGLQGNAILSKYPLSNPKIIDLPICFEPFEYVEKRYGRRIALSADIFIQETKIRVVCTHLEVRNSPDCRAKQMATILETIRSGGSNDPVLLGGDLNCNTFRRGTRWRSYSGFLRILLSDTQRLKQDLLQPFAHGERLFKILEAHGYSFLEFNDPQATSSASLKGIEDSLKLPVYLSDLALAKLKDHNYRLDLKLDWIAALKLRALSDAEVHDSSAGVYSIAPRTIKGLTYQSRDVADHDPIVADVRFDNK